MLDFLDLAKWIWVYTLIFILANPKKYGGIRALSKIGNIIT